MKTNKKGQPKRRIKSQPAFVGIWKFLATGCLVLSIGGTFIFLLFDPETSINFSLNIATEAIGIVATVVFVQRYLDKANQKEIEQTNNIVKRNLNELKKSLVSKNNLEPRVTNRKHRSTENYSRKKQIRLNGRSKKHP